MLRGKFILLSPNNFLPNLAEELIRQQAVSDAKLSDYLLIMPNRRSGIYLKYYISQTINSPVLAPDVFSLEDFIDYYYESFVKSDIKISSWDALCILFDVFRETGIFPDFLDFIHFGDKIFKDFEELKIQRKDKKTVEVILQELDLPNTSKTKLILERYPDAYEKFYMELESRGYSTRSLRYLRVADEIKRDGWLSEKRIILIPPFLLTECERIIIEKLLEWDNFYMLLQKSRFVINEFKSYTQKYGVIPGEELVELNKFPSNVKVEFIPTDDDISEVLILKDKLSCLNEDLLNSIETGVVLPDAHKLIPIIDLGLPDNVKDFNISMGYPIKFSNYFTFIKDLRELFLFSQSGDGNYLFDIRKLRNFLDRNISIKDDANGVSDFIGFLDSLSGDGYTFLDTKLIKDLIESKCESKATRFLHIWSVFFDGFLRGILDSRNFSEFLEVIMKFFSNSNTFDVSFKPKESLEGMFDVFLLELMNIKSSLVATVKLPDEKNSLEKASGFLELLELITGNITVPLKGTPLRGLQIIGFLETRLLNFKKLFIIDVQEDLLPLVEKESDRLLPYDLRIKMGLFDIRSKEKLFEYLFFTLIESSDECTIIYKDNETDEPSHFIFILKEYLKEISGNNEVPKHVTFYSSKTVSFDYNPNFENGIPKTSWMIDVARNLSFSYTAIETYLECPIKFLFTYIFGLREEIEDEYDVRRIGTAIHKILERFFKRANKEITESSNDYVDFEEIAEEVLAEEYPVETPRIRVLKEVIKIRVRNSLERLQKKLKDELKDKIRGKLLGYETELQVNKLINVNGREINFTGKVDRIDVYQDGLVILDYKTSGSVEKYKKGSDIKKILESIKGNGKVSHSIESPYIQLPVYFWLISGDTMRNKFSVEPNVPVFVCVVPLRNYQLKLQVSQYESDIYEIVEECLRRIISEILDENIEFYLPELSKRKSRCRYCAFRSTCKTL